MDWPSVSGLPYLWLKMLWPCRGQAYMNKCKCSENGWILLLWSLEKCKGIVHSEIKCFLFHFLILHEYQLWVPLTTNEIPSWDLWNLHMPILSSNVLCLHLNVTNELKMLITVTHKYIDLLLKTCINPLESCGFILWWMVVLF